MIEFARPVAPDSTQSPVATYTTRRRVSTDGDDTTPPAERLLAGRGRGTVGICGAELRLKLRSAACAAHQERRASTSRAVGVGATRLPHVVGTHLAREDVEAPLLFACRRIE